MTAPWSGIPLLLGWNKQGPFKHKSRITNMRFPVQVSLSIIIIIKPQLQFWCLVWSTGNSGACTDLPAGPQRIHCTSQPREALGELRRVPSPLSTSFLICKMGAYQRLVWLVSIKLAEGCPVCSHVSPEWSWRRAEGLKAADSSVPSPLPHWC